MGFRIFLVLCSFWRAGEVAETAGGSRSAGHLEASTRGFDVNRAPSLSAAVAAGAAAAAAAASSSPNNSAGSFPADFSAHGQTGPGPSGGGGDRAGFRASDEDDGGSARKKLRLSKEQSAFLEESFKEHSTLNTVSILPKLQHF